MGRSRNSHRLATNRDCRRRNQAASRGNDQGDSRQRSIRQNDISLAPVLVTRRPYQALAVSVLLLLGVGLVFGQTGHYAFVNFDDNVYVDENPHISRAFSPQAVAWVFTHEHGATGIR